MRDLHSHIVKQYAVHWERLGLELGLMDYHIANISVNNARYQNKVEVCCTAVLQQWLDIDPSATWAKLDDAIKKIKLSSTTSPVSTDKGGNHECKLLVTMITVLWPHIITFCYCCYEIMLGSYILA